MATFTGTQTKCKVCEKTVYLVDQLIADGAIFHKACFRCQHCKTVLKTGNFASLEGVLYCKPHFQQLFKQTGSYKASFDEAIKHEKEHVPPPESVTSGIGKLSVGEKKAPSAFAGRFQGTQDKCVACGKTVYPLEKTSVENTTYHKNCFKCVHGGCKLTPSTYQALESKLYCKAHYTQLFLSKGNYSELKKAGSTAASEGTAAPDAPKTEAPKTEAPPASPVAPATPTTPAK
eukprot:jgi/Mesen1/2748/ME000169S01912